MSSNYWQTKKLSGQYGHGKTLTEKIKGYTQTWENRCYKDGIPDEVPNKIMKVNRAPSYKAIALAILKNDHHLISLGFSGPDSDWYRVLKKEHAQKNDPQLKLNLHP